MQQTVKMNLSEFVKEDNETFPLIDYMYTAQSWFQFIKDNVDKL